MLKPIRIIIADDHPMLLKGLKNELEIAGYTVCAAVTNGAQAHQAIMQFNPDIAILDVEMPILSGFEVIKKFEANQDIKTRFVVLTSHKEKGIIVKANQLNISGYMLKDEPFEQLQVCINNVFKGEKHFSSTFDNVMTTEVNPQIEKIKFLSPSERTILRMVTNGLTSQDISTSLSISIRTVQKHRSNIIGKLGLNDTGNSLSIWALDHKELILSL